ncbi:glycosyltransferase family 2 protein [Actinoplanes sp. CA-131856]
MTAQYRPDVSIVLPCLNERSSVGEVVRHSLATLERLRLPGEVVVCDNGSHDGSADLARSAGARVVLQPVRGYGISVLTAAAAASGRVLVVMDADGSYSCDDIGHLVAPVLSGHVDYARGSRFSDGTSPRAMTFGRRYIGNPALTALLRHVGGTAWTDGQSGMWAISADLLQKMNLRSRGMEFAHEMLLEIQRSGARWVEIPIEYLPRQGRSKLRPVRDGVRHLSFLWRWYHRPADYPSSAAN